MSLTDILHSLLAPFSTTELYNFKLILALSQKQLLIKWPIQQVQGHILFKPAQMRLDTVLDCKERKPSTLRCVWHFFRNRSCFQNQLNQFWIAKNFTTQSSMPTFTKCYHLAIDLLVPCSQQNHLACSIQFSFINKQYCQLMHLSNHKNNVC